MQNSQEASSLRYSLMRILSDDSSVSRVSVVKRLVTHDVYPQSRGSLRRKPDAASDDKTQPSRPPRSLPRAL